MDTIFTMQQVSKESLEILRDKIDIVDLLSSYMDLKKSGSSYKGLCPFHEEKTPSFVIQAGQQYYHCFGCGAHGDGIEFLRQFLALSFMEAVELLAERYGVVLEQKEESKQEIAKSTLKRALEKAVAFYHFFLLHTKEGQKGLCYLYQRGYSLAFIKKFRLGWASRDWPILEKYLQEEKIDLATMMEAGLIKNAFGKRKEFFVDRVLIPIFDASGSAVGFTARKIDGEGPKYINTPETSLFKKSKILFGLNYSRRTIVKEKKALIVEGQFDALRLIDYGITSVIASQGTAFTEEHAKELIHLGVKEVDVAFDADNAGFEAAEKIGHLFQKEGIDVKVLSLPEGIDPDSLLFQEGIEGWEKLYAKRKSFLSFLVFMHTKKVDLSSPAQKNALIKMLKEKISQWDHPLMVHESLKKVAELLQVPLDMMGIASHEKQYIIQQKPSMTFSEINPDKALEGDFLRWIILMDKSFLELAEKNISAEWLKIAGYKKLYLSLIEKKESVFLQNADPEQKFILSEIMQKKVNLEKAKVHFVDVMQKIIDRNWMDKREEIKQQIFYQDHSEEKLAELAKEFDRLKKARPQLQNIEAFLL